MKKNSPISIIIIVVVAALAVWYLAPSILYYSKPAGVRAQIRKEKPETLDKVLNLGLDLQGGMRLVLEIDDSELSEEESKDALDRAYAVIENRINALGVAEPVIQKQGRERLIVELPGLSDKETAKRVIGSTAQLEFNLLREPADLQRAIEAIDNALKGKKVEADTAVADTSKEAEEKAQREAERLFEGADVEEADTADTALMAEGAEGEPPQSFSEYLIGLGSGMIGVKERDRNTVNEMLAQEKVQLALDRIGLGNAKFLWGHDAEKLDNTAYRPLYFVKKRAELKGDIIRDAQPSIAQGGIDAGQAIVSLELNGEGASKFSRVTGDNVNKFMAIVLDNTVYSAPQIRQKIPHGQAQITGSFTMEEAKGLAIVLRAGALPAPVDIIEERTIGPSLGQDSIQKATYAFTIGFLLVVIFMIVYYKTSGAIADFALLLNLIFVVAIMASIGATLTLPGIAGLILIIGMSVDANVIIFERIREELDIGKTIRSAVDSGYSRAFLTIMDANITTLITAFILLWIGTGPIKGFAVTLIFGIIVSLFTALFVTRVLFNMVTANRNLKTLSI